MAELLYSRVGATLTMVKDLPLTKIFNRARTATSPSVRLNVERVTFEQMAEIAMRLFRVHGRRALTAQNIHDLGYGFDVSLANTSAIAAQVVPLRSKRNDRHSKMVGPNDFVRSTTEIEFPITVRLDSTEPNPTRSEVGTQSRNRPVFVDFAPKALGCRSWSRPHHALNFTTEGCANPVTYGRV